MHADEASLIAGLRAGDKEAFRSAVVRYGPQMLAVARSIAGAANAEDVVQEAWLTVLRKVDGFEGRAAFSTWLIRIVSNGAISHLRSRSREVAPSAYDGEEPDTDWFDDSGRWATPPTGWDASSPEDLLNADALGDCIDRHLALMPDTQRAVLVLRDIQQQSFTDICNELDISSSNVRVLLHRGRLKLMKTINGFQETGEC